LKLRLAKELKGKVRIAYGIFEWKGGKRLEESEKEAVLKKAVENYRIEPSRKLYRLLGIDPTKHRPACEALYRRYLKKGVFPAIHPVVDAINLLSVINSLPYGLYDLEKVKGEVRIRTGSRGEGYRGIGREWVNLEGRLLLEDEKGPFGNPTGDSDRTKVTSSSEKFFYTIFAPAGHLIEEASKITEDKLCVWLGVKITETGVIG